MTRSLSVRSGHTEQGEKKKIVCFLLYFKKFQMILLGGTLGRFFNQHKKQSHNIKPQSKVLFRHKIEKMYWCCTVLFTWSDTRMVADEATLFSCSLRLWARLIKAVGPLDKVNDFSSWFPKTFAAVQQRPSHKKKPNINGNLKQHFWFWRPEQYSWLLLVFCKHKSCCPTGS